jgi:hypothetical protein
MSTHFPIIVAKIVLVRVSVTSVTSVTPLNESFDRKNIGYDLINNPYVSIYESVYTIDI